MFAGGEQHVYENPTVNSRSPSEISNRQPTTTYEELDLERISPPAEIHDYSEIRYA